MVAWGLYYLAWAVYILVGGLALWRGRAPERWLVVIIAAALGLEQLAFVGDFTPVPISYLWLEIATNCLQAAGIVWLIVYNRVAKWLGVALLIKSIELAFDGLVLQESPQLTHAFLPRVSDTMSIALMMVLGWAVFRSPAHQPASIGASPADFVART